MRSAAQFHRHPRHIHNTHHVGVLLAKHGNGTSRLRLVNRHLLHQQAMGLGDPAIDQRFDLP